MKTMVTYYSYSGITDKVINIFLGILKGKGEVKVQRLIPRGEITTFIGQCRAAFLKKRAELKEEIEFDLKNYDLLLIGSPVWAFAPTPAINTYLDKVSGLEGKAVIILLTSGSGAGVNKCFNNIKRGLLNKGASRVDTVNIPNRIMSDENLIKSSLEKIL